MSQPASAATDEQLETLWERLAEAVDRAGPQRERLFLAKFALLAARALADPGRVEQLIASALEDLT